MPQFTESTVIRAPIEQVFAAITDPRRAAEWNPNILSVSNVTEGPIGSGTQWEQVLLVNGRQVRLTCRIVQFNPPTSGVLKISGEQQAHVRTRCEAAGDATRVHQDVDFVMPCGKLGALASGFVKSALQREVRLGLERQRAALEAERRGENGPRA